MAPAVVTGQGVVPPVNSGFRGGALGVRGAAQEHGVALFRSEDLIAAAKAPSTRKRYSQLWSQFETFCVNRERTPLPASSRTVLDFLVHLVNGGKGGSAGASLAAIKDYHLNAHVQDPTQEREVMLAAEGASRITADRKGWPKERGPLPVEALLTFMRSPSFSSALGLRDATLVAVGLRLMLRPGEIVKLKLESVRMQKDGALVRLGRSKADQKAQRKPLLIESSASPACPVKLLQSLIRARKAQGATDEDLLFIGAAGRPLTTSAVSSVIRRMAEAHGLDPKSFSGHSLRIGGASAALAGGLTVDQVKAVGGWKSAAVNQYLESPKKKFVSRKMGF